jgi:hypothetical protein
MGDTVTNDNQPNGPGRPTELADGKRLNVYLDSRSLEVATRLGDGNLSLGIRLALEASEPVTIESIIERIRSRHILKGVNPFLNDLEKIIDGLVAGNQGSVLESLELDDPDLIRKLRQRDSFKLAALNNGFDCYELWGDGYVVTQHSEVQQYLKTIGGRLWEDGAFHIEGREYETYSGAEFEDALEKWLGNEQGFCQIQATQEEAWQDACARHSIPPVVLKPEVYFIVSDTFADELEKQGEIVSTKLMGNFRIWGCLDQVRYADDFAAVPVLKRIAKSERARRILLGIPKRS